MKMPIKATKRYYDMPFAGLNGIFLEEHVMKKVAKLVYRQNQELKELLQANIDSIEVANWTLAYPNGKQEVVHYIGEKWQTKEQRIALVDRTSAVRFLEHVYIGTAKEAEAEHMRLYDENTEISLTNENGELKGDEAHAQTT